MSQLPSISVVIPCWGRINGTRSIITNVLNQTIYNWEAIIIGDGCPDFQSLIDSGEMENFAQRAKNLNSQIIYKNLEEHKGGWGYECLNTAIDLARSKFLLDKLTNKLPLELRGGRAGKLPPLDSTRDGL